MEFGKVKSTFVRRLDMSSEVTEQRPSEDVYMDENSSYLEEWQQMIECP